MSKPKKKCNFSKPVFLSFLSDGMSHISYPTREDIGKAVAKAEIIRVIWQEIANKRSLKQENQQCTIVGGGGGGVSLFGFCGGFCGGAHRKIIVLGRDVWEGMVPVQPCLPRTRLSNFEADLEKGKLTCRKLLIGAPWNRLCKIQTEKWMSEMHKWFPQAQ